MTDKTISHFRSAYSPEQTLTQKNSSGVPEQKPMLKLKKVYIIRNISPNNRDDVERVQHFMK
ncbi:MAG: hypothetical protein WBE34_07435 [Candidatus Nitrosopolaris sp.]